MTTSTRTHVMIGAVSVLCLLLAGTAFFLLREIGPGPASLLPAERTVMLVTNMSPATQRAWQDILPDLKNAPLLEQGTDIAALVRTNSGSEWVTFDMHGAPSNQSVLLQEGETSLSSDYAYSRLRTTYAPSSPWLFARFPETALTINGLRVPSSTATITVGTGSIRVAWPSRMTAGFTGPVIDKKATSVFLLNAANLSTFIADASGMLTDAVHVPVRALLQSWVRRTVGDDISLTYDVTAMLDGAGVVVAASSSGAVDIAVRALPSAPANDTISRMEQGAMFASGNAEHVERMFDDQFSFETIKATEANAIMQDERGGWSVRTAIPEVFINAVSGREFAVATGDAILNAVIMASLGDARQEIASGRLTESYATEFLKKWHIGLNLPWTLVPGTGPHIQWNLSRQGGLAVLEMERTAE